MADISSLTPVDDHNRYQENVFPSTYQNPKPKSKYHAVVIGGGTAGRIVAIEVARLGASVALIEEQALGGECFNQGAIPIMSLIHSSRCLATLKRATTWGISTGPLEINSTIILQRMRNIRAKLSWNVSWSKCQSLGVDVFLGHASFIDSTHVDVQGQRLQFIRGFIATGTKAVMPSIPGLTGENCLTTESWVDIQKVPQRLAIVGSEPHGVELAQAFQRFGSQVTFLNDQKQMLPSLDEICVNWVEKQLQKEGMQIYSLAQNHRVEPRGSYSHMVFESQGKELEADVDKILVAGAPQPRVHGLGLETIGVAYHEEKGIKINAQLQTTLPHIFAVGDVALHLRVPQAAEASARIAVRNAFLPRKANYFEKIIPHTVYTSPEIAQVGQTPLELKAAKIPFKTVECLWADMDRAQIDGEEDGIIRLHFTPSGNRCLGASMVGSQVDQLITVLALAMQENCTIHSLAQLVAPYPTLMDGIRLACQQFQQNRVTPMLKTLLKAWIHLRE
jgi:pyruvate/2-oxoglutarate dehydrogenase complex dihydrolipoamide dehydrogenase (E3) component